MIRAALASLALCASLSACAPSAETAAEARNANSGAKSLDIGNKNGRCLPASKMSLYTPSNELVGDIRTRFLTPEASLARIRVFVSGTDVSGYGSTSVFYTNETADCVLWAETITIQELAQRAGLSPLGISPFYLPDNPKASETPATK
jgi:hypothetical protein